MDDALYALARAHGIILEYHDIWGQPHHPTQAALLGVLAAMGFEVPDANSARKYLEETLAARGKEILPPVVVARAGKGPWTLRLQLSEAMQAMPLRWILQEEQGQAHEVRFAADALPHLGEHHIGAERIIARELAIHPPVPLGYHHLRLYSDDRPLFDVLFAVVPERCYVPSAIEHNGRLWGVTAQLYAVRSRRNWGIGDYTDLTALVEFWGRRGAGLIGLNPQHASFPHNPAHASPYSPNSREFKNWLYIDVEAIAEFERSQAAQALVRSPTFQGRLSRLRATDLVDHVGVAAAKREVLEILYGEFCAHDLRHDSARGRAFRTYQKNGGAALRRFALFDALQEKFAGEAATFAGWQSWPEPFRDPDSAAVQQCCAEHEDRVHFFEYLQWQADTQLAGAGKRCLDLGLPVGLYEDLAVSADGAGAESWSNQKTFALQASVGAPPDELNLKGQDWGLPPLIPEQLRAAHYAPFVATLRANMRHSGALRIDHVMAMMRLYWVPPDTGAADGVYVHYPFPDLLGLLALESQRNRCMVIGEDLGTVPDEVRHELHAAGVLSYRVLYFERDQQGDFKPPSSYPQQALVVATTHDLPTLAGWWASRDIAVRTDLELYPNEALREAQIAGRAHDRWRLLRALDREGRLPPVTSKNPDEVPQLDSALRCAVHAYLASTPACTMVVQLEDVLGAGEQVNVPGTVNEYPNWRRKLTLDLDDYANDARVAAMIAALSEQRP